MYSDDEVFDGSCSCHSHPPCGWCMSLTEEEASIVWSKGRDALYEYWKKNGWERKSEEELSS